MSRKASLWLGGLLAVAAFCSYSYPAYVERQRDYHTGFLLGGSSFLVADGKALDCLKLELDALQNRNPSPNCEVQGLSNDSAMEEAMAAECLSGQNIRNGFKDGWRNERAAVFAERAKIR